MDVREFLRVILRRLWIILLALVVVVGATFVVSSRMTPIYSAETTIRVAPPALGEVDYGDYVYAERLMNTYSKIILTEPVLDEVKERLELTELPQIETAVIPETELLTISVESSNPAIARDVANSLAQVIMFQAKEVYAEGGDGVHELIEAMIAETQQEIARTRSQRDWMISRDYPDTEQLDMLNRNLVLKEQELASLQTQYQAAQLAEFVRANTISVVEPAPLPGQPSSPRLLVNLLLGSLVGLALGVGLALLIENVDRTLYSSDQIEASVELPVLGRVPNTKVGLLGRNNGSLSSNGFSIELEAYRLMRTNIVACATERSLTSLMITSADPDEGKSTLTVNLAAAFSEVMTNVIVVDADLRLPAVHRLLNLDNGTGLSSVLSGHLPLDDAIQIYELAGFHVLTSGPLPQNPTQLLEARYIQDLISHLSWQYDVVLFDAPCLSSVTDAAVLGPQVDGVLLVVGRGKTRWDSLNAALEQLENVKANTLGIIINRAEYPRASYYYAPKKERARHFKFTGLL